MYSVVLMMTYVQQKNNTKKFEYFCLKVCPSLNIGFLLSRTFNLCKDKIGLQHIKWNKFQPKIRISRNVEDLSAAVQTIHEICLGM